MELTHLLVLLCTGCGYQLITAACKPRFAAIAVVQYSNIQIPCCDAATTKCPAGLIRRQPVVRVIYCTGARKMYCTIKLLEPLPPLKKYR